MYGLSWEEYKTLQGILHTHGKNLNWVKIFGSRARGDYRGNSDLDLAVSFGGCESQLLAAGFEESTLPYTVDIVDYENIESLKLRENILRDGKLIFSANQGDKDFIMERLKLKQEEYRRALKRLHEALDRDITQDDLYLDGILQRFEFTFELAWKLLKVYLAYGGITANSPRSAIREGFKEGIVGDGTLWLDMLEKRNLSSHTYEEETARKICQRLKEKYITALDGLAVAVENTLYQP